MARLVQIVPPTPSRIEWRVVSAPPSCLHSPLCCCCEASSWAPGLVSPQCLFSIKWIWRFWMFMNFPGWSCAASYFFITSHTAEYPMASSDQDNIRAAGGASSLLRNARVKEVGRFKMVRDLLSDV
eukprot:1162050-Pelagomonas_calceolata.AAC.4